MASALPHPSRFHLLDTLRGLAALAVVFFHWRHFSLAQPGLAATFKQEDQPFYDVFFLFYRSGYLAVDLFFCLSGFIFFWLYLAPIAGRVVSARDFFVLRFSRLYPLHFCTLVLVAIGQFAYLLNHDGSFVFQNNDLRHFILNIFLIPSIGLERGYSFNAPVWSVSVEALLYALFFIYCRLAKPRPVHLVALSAFGFVVLAQLYPPVGRGVGSFFLGGCVYFIYLHVLRHKYRDRLANGVAITMLALWACTWYLAHENYSIGDFSNIPYSALFFPVAILFPVTILAFALMENRWGAVASRLSFLGDISYSTYLWHFPLQIAFVLAASRFNATKSLTTSPLAFLLFFAILIALSAASFRYLEMPVQRRIRRDWLAKAVRRPA